MSAHTTPLALALSPCCNQFDLPLPPGTDEGLNKEQTAKVNAIRLQFAQDAAKLASAAYGEIQKVVAQNCEGRSGSY